VKPPLNITDDRHGTLNGYINLKCRCMDCCKANTQDWLQRRNARKERGLPVGDHRHGTLNGYNNWGCRCDDCTRANRDYSRSRNRRVSS